MKKNQIFEFTDSNGVVVTAVVIDLETAVDPCDGSFRDQYLCYAQNRLFYYMHRYGHSKVFIGDNGYESFYEEKDIDENVVGTIIVEYCIIPELDSLLEAHFHQLDMADDYASREC